MAVIRSPSQLFRGRGPETRLPTFAVKSLWGGVEVTAPHFPVEDNVLYGASACIFFELLARLAAALEHELPSFHYQDEAPWGQRYAK